MEHMAQSCEHDKMRGCDERFLLSVDKGSCWDLCRQGTYSKEAPIQRVCNFGHSQDVQVCICFSTAISTVKSHNQ